MANIEDHPMQLVPHSGVQFITRFLNLAEASRFRRAFVERPRTTGMQPNRKSVWLYPDWSVDDPSRQGDILDKLPDDELYTIKAENALEPYLGKWVPVPYLRVKNGRTPGGGEAYDNGPTNWARVRVISEIGGGEDNKYTHRVIFAIDTELKMPGDNDTSGPYAAPLVRDAEGQRIFRLVSDMSRLSWFVQGNPEAALASNRNMQDDPQLWVDQWLETLFLEFKGASLEAGATGNRRELRLRYVHEHAARWYAFIDLIAEYAKPPRLTFIDTVSDRVNETDPSTRMVDVDFVLDVGNSRTCGILVERFPNQKTVDLNNCKPLRLRDLSRPEFVYTEPFESHVELAAANFGSERISRMSGRGGALFWPSFVRIGPEAARVRSEGAAGRTTGGMSSPKRYLWDMDAVQLEWRFPAKSYYEGIGPLVERRVRRWVNQNGDVLSKVHSDSKIFRSLYGRQNIEDIKKTGPRLTFSRSSFYTFMLVEVIWQAWVMINDPEIRAKRGEQALPRRMRKIILTLPTATPVREQRIMRARAESALALLWDMMGWSETPPVGVTRPEVEVRWDEATCVQLVWLYGEISRKFAGNVEAFLNLVGRKRPVLPGNASVSAPSLRVASIDIGGGTTDLMIITYTQVGDRGLRPQQNFREGVRIAGDDILKLVAERIVLPAIQRQLESCGLSSAAARTLVKGCFDEFGVSAEDRHRRWQLTIEAIVPAALALIHAYEKAAPGMYDRFETRTLGELVEEEGYGPNLRQVSSYLEERAADIGAKEFSLAETVITIDCTAVRDAASDALGDVFDILGEALDHFDVDLLILSGRPARMPAITEMLADRFAVGPNRMVGLHCYRPGTWFPFGATESGRISDPKTAVVVGALLCTYAKGSLEDFFYESDGIQMRSTARYLGFLGKDGKMTDQNVLFEPSAGGAQTAAEAEKETEHYGPRPIGARQLPFERWVTAPLYLLSFDARTGQPALPIKVTLTRKLDEVDPDDTFAKKLEAEASKEQIAIELAEDSSASARNVKDKMVLSFRTIASESHWLDTGVLTLP